MNHFNDYDVVIVPFPFTDKSSDKRRPALVVSSGAKFNAPAGHCVLAMITSSENEGWPLDTEISDLDSASLPAPSKVRMKLFTLDNRFILRTIGALAAKDRTAVKRALSRLLSI